MTEALKVGYIFQYESESLSKPSATAAAQHIKAIVNGVKQHGHQVRLMSLRQGRPAWTEDFVHWQAGRLGTCQERPFRMLESVLRGIQSRLQLPYLNLFDSYRFSDACASELAAYDILYERYWLLSYGGLIAARRLGIPLVLEVNGDLLEELGQLGFHLSRGQWLAINLINRLLFRYVDHVIAVGETIRKRTIHRWGFHPSKSSVVMNGVDIASLDPSLGSNAIRLRFQLDRDPMVIFVGSFQPWHGVDLLVEAFPHILSSNSKVRLLLVGDGQMRQEVEKKVDGLGVRSNVIFAGRIPPEDVREALYDADVAVICHSKSAAELVETPLKLFEYMAAAKAIVAPAVPNMERILTHEVTALLVPPDNPEALAAAVVRLLEDPALRSSLGSAARRQAIEKHSWDRTVSEVEEIMFDLVTTCRKRHIGVRSQECTSETL